MATYFKKLESATKQKTITFNINFFKKNKMKKYIIMLLLCIIGISASANATVPELVKITLAKKFPNATKVKWAKENATEYDAAFTLNGKHISANFKNNGEWLETETIILYFQLRQTVSKAFIKLHNTAKPKAVAKINTKLGNTKYEIEFKKGAKTIEEFYNENGELIDK